jgi:hypothetical protein
VVALVAASAPAAVMAAQVISTTTERRPEPPEGEQPAQHNQRRYNCVAVAAVGMAVMLTTSIEAVPVAPVAARCI